MNMKYHDLIQRLYIDQGRKCIMLESVKGQKPIKDFEFDFITENGEYISFNSKDEITNDLQLEIFIFSEGDFEVRCNYYTGDWKIERKKGKGAIVFSDYDCEEEQEFTIFIGKLSFNQFTNVSMRTYDSDEAEYWKRVIVNTVRRDIKLIKK